MKRRDLFRLAPLSFAGLAGLSRTTQADDLRYDYPSVDDYRRPTQKSHEPLAIQYTKKVRDMLMWIRETQSENMLEASYAIAKTVMKGRTCWYSWDMGHSIDFDIGLERNSLPEIFTVGYNADKARDGDLFLNNINGSEAVLEDLAKKDIITIGTPVPWGSDARGSRYIVRDSALHRLRPSSDIWIETNIDTIGAIMRLPGMPAPIGPVSGIIGMATFWMMVADACRILAREGESVPVRGDEPKLKKDVGSGVNLYEPLMDDYFENLMLQIDMIGAELGDIQKVARMSVDAVLAGGQVWGYSRDRMALAVEAQTRRGGLTMMRGMYYDETKGKVVTYGGEEIKGSSNDLVIMGLFKPDDPIDLKCLDLFRKQGMKTASIGPMTRNMAVPEGRTVPKEVDVHIGRMCDTYGLYEFPGFERKVCPTSGALVNQIFWAICMEIVTEMKHRTGNVPGVFFSAATRGGTEHMHRMNDWHRERGY
ncbi:hypothetical protein ACFL47_09960 [Candidatus Latescibacterota bacterium]